jgi:hypothetical protein
MSPAAQEIKFCSYTDNEKTSLGLTKLARHISYISKEVYEGIPTTMELMNSQFSTIHINQNGTDQIEQ